MTLTRDRVPPKSRPVISHWRWGFWIFALAAALLVAPFRVVRVVGHSMMPTLRPGQSVLVDRLWYRVTGLYRMDLVVLHHDGEDWVKRLVGLPGDRIALVYGPDGDIGGVLNLHSGLRPPPRARLITVPAGKLFVLGDNMAVSKDSRTAGPLLLTELIGVVRTPLMGRYFPPPGASPAP
jgi:signal peptidase I